jgi:hypothetical protein
MGLGETKTVDELLSGDSGRSELVARKTDLHRLDELKALREESWPTVSSQDATAGRWGFLCQELNEAFSLAVWRSPLRQHDEPIAHGGNL